MKKTKVSISKKGVRYFHESEKIDRAAEKLERVINSHAFKKAIKQHEFFGKRGFVQSNGFSNEEILERLLEGSEILGSKVDFEWNIHLKIIDRPWYKKWSKAQGFTYPNTLEISIYRDSFHSMSDVLLAAFIAHEQCHNLGFEHDFRATMRRKYSVPYAVGSIVASVYQRGA